MMKTAIASLLLAIAASAFAQSDDLINADRPGIADGSQTIGRGKFQIETGLERDDSDGLRALFTPTLLRYGVTDKFELRVEGNGWERDTFGGASTTGWNPFSIGAKYHFHDTPSLGIIARVFPKSGSGDFRSDAVTGDLRLAADMDLNEHWSINPNVGVAFEDDGGRFTAALAALTVQ